jgi:hypothetical protein
MSSIHHGSYKAHQRDVRIDGPDASNDARESQQRSAGVPIGWTVGDIDFDEDGALFIRNPYLANAIERQLKKNNAAYNPSDPKSFIFKLTRDEGFSGPKVDVVC